MVRIGFSFAGPESAVDSRALLLSLIHLQMYVVPLFAFVLSYAGVIAEREQGTLDLLLSYPIAYRDLILGKWLGFSAILCVAVATGISGAAVTDDRRRHPGPRRCSSFRMLSLLLGFSCVALGLALSCIARDRTAAIAACVVLWVFFVFIFDLGFVFVQVVTEGSLPDAARAGDPAAESRRSVSDRSDPAAAADGRCGDLRPRGGCALDAVQPRRAGPLDRRSRGRGDARASALAARRFVKPRAFGCALALALALGCGQKAEERDAAAPEELTGAEVCAVDGMILRDYDGPKAQILWRDGRRTFYCEAREAFAEWSDRIRRKRILEFYVQDFADRPWGHYPGHWIRAGEAVFVIESEMRGAMGSSFVSFRDPEHAAAFRGRARRPGAAPWTKSRPTSTRLPSRRISSG